MTIYIPRALFEDQTALFVATAAIANVNEALRMVYALVSSGIFAWLDHSRTQMSIIWSIILSSPINPCLLYLFICYFFAPVYWCAYRNNI